jgi:hypothetical protein
LFATRKSKKLQLYGPKFTSFYSCNLGKSPKVFETKKIFFFHLLNPIFSTRIDKLMVMKLFEQGVNLIKPFFAVNLPMPFRKLDCLLIKAILGKDLKILGSIFSSNQRLLPQMFLN